MPKSSGVSFCEEYVEAKMFKKPYKPLGEIRSTRKLQCVHSDVCGPMSTESIGGKRYFVTFIDDYSRCCKVYFMRNKSKVFNKFKEFELCTTNECGLTIGTLRSDNGGEYLSDEFQSYLQSKGIHHELSAPYSPSQNGVAERINRTLMESARAMMTQAGLPNHYWAEAVSTAAYLRNRVSTRSLKEKQTPYEKWYGRKPDVSHLRVFGCMAYAYILDANRNGKLSKKAERLPFIGYSLQMKGYRLIDEDILKVIVRRDVIFNESDFLKGSTSVEINQSVCNESGSIPEENEQMPQVIHEEGQCHYPRRQKTAPVRYGIDEYADTAFVIEGQVKEPQSIEEALKSEFSEQWNRATDSEYQSLLENETWKLVKLPSGRKPVGCRWIFKSKRGKDGKIERYKALLVAKGYTQRYGGDYDETFSPVVRYSSVRALLPYAVQNEMMIHQMDVITAFLNGSLEEEIYMEQPPGYISEEEKDLVCK